MAQTVTEIKQTGGIATSCVADISKENTVQHAITETLSHYGKIDIVVQNAGIYPSCMIEDMSLNAWRNVIDINLTGSFIVLKSAHEALKKQQGGRVIFISSIAGDRIGYTGFSHYTASKSGMNGFMRTAALELAKHKITVNSIDPGNIVNEEANHFSQSEIDKMKKTIPLGRLGQPADIANLALFLASDESSFITGQHFIVDGGETV